MYIVVEKVEEYTYDLKDRKEKLDKHINKELREKNIFSDIESILDEYDLAKDVAICSIDTSKNTLSVEEYYDDDGDPISKTSKQYLDFLKGIENVKKYITVFHVSFMYKFNVSPSMVRNKFNIAAK